MALLLLVLSCGTALPALLVLRVMQDVQWMKTPWLRGKRKQKHPITV